ncbi:high-potential iron-sulfur protein, partial [Salinigranum sp.]|uniref:high-potential iron-sulfur protein n=1 Tax=Salinigranum sp. TaxID=1966351 RepID=UPI0035635DB9
RDTTRRRFVSISGTVALGTLAGCTGGGGDGGDSTTTASGGDGESVPSQYETATSIGGNERKPGSLASKDAVNYKSSPNGGQKCSGCTYYIEDKNGDDLGACSIVQGTIEPNGWCASFVPHQE